MSNALETESQVFYRTHWQKRVDVSLVFTHMAGLEGFTTSGAMFHMQA